MLIQDAEVPGNIGGADNDDDIIIAEQCLKFEELKIVKEKEDAKVLMHEHQAKNKLLPEQKIRYAMEKATTIEVEEEQLKEVKEKDDEVPEKISKQHLVECDDDINEPNDKTDKPIFRNLPPNNEEKAVTMDELENKPIISSKLASEASTPVTEEEDTVQQHDNVVDGKDTFIFANVSLHQVVICVCCSLFFPTIE